MHLHSIRFHLKIGSCKVQNQIYTHIVYRVYTYINKGSLHTRDGAMLFSISLPPREKDVLSKVECRREHEVDVKKHQKDNRIVLHTNNHLAGSGPGAVSEDGGAYCVDHVPVFSSRTFIVIGNQRLQWCMYQTR